MRARLKVSRAGVELIKSFEGLRQVAARLPDGRWTLGYGHTFSAREGAKVTPEDAESLLRFDLLPIVDGINNNVLVALNQHQFDALVSFAFNIGLDNFLSSNVLRRINEGRPTEAALAMESWRSAEFGGQTYVLAPLIRRRAAEKNLFLTPVAASDTAPSLLVRPLEDPRTDEPVRATAEVEAPVLAGHLTARPLGEPDLRATPYPAQPAQPYPSQPYPASPYGGQPAQPYTPPVTPQPYPAAPYAQPQPYPASPAPVSPSPYGGAPSYAPQPEEAPRTKPIVVRVAELGSAPAATGYDAEPAMSPAVKAALEAAQAEAEARQRAEDARRLEALRAEEAARQAQIEAQLKAQRDAEAAAFFAAEEARRLEAERLDAQRQLADRMERERFEAERAEAQRQEDARLAIEAERQRLEQVRIAAEKAEADRIEGLRLESERQRQEADRLEAERTEAVRIAAEKADAERKRAEETAAVKPAGAPADAPSEEGKRADAMANLMRFYSPYAASPMGKPLGPIRTPQAPAAPVAPAEPEASRPVYPSYPPAQTTPAPAPAQPATQAANVTPPVNPSAPRPVSELPSEIEALPGLVIETPEPTILSPSALVPPAVFASTPSTPRPAQADVVETARPTAVRPQGAAARDMAADTQANWRDRLERPEPGNFPKPVAPATAGQVGAAQPYHSPARVVDESVADEDDLMWDDEHARIAMLAEDDDADHPSFMSMLGSTLGWLTPSFLGITSLGGAAAAFYKSSDPQVVREGYYDFYFHTSLVLAILGLVLVLVSIWMILRRLGGLKE